MAAFVESEPVDNQVSKGSEASESDNTATAAEQSTKEMQVEEIPNADSIINYEEVLESTPEDARNNIDAIAAEPKQKDSEEDKVDDDTPSEANDDEETKMRVKQALSSSSGEPPMVADERIPIQFENKAESESPEAPDFDAQIVDNNNEDGSFNQEVTPEQLQASVRLDQAVDTAQIKVSRLERFPVTLCLLLQPSSADDNVEDEEEDDKISQDLSDEEESAIPDETNGLGSDKDQIKEFLEKWNLTDVVRSSEPDGGLETEYFLQLTNGIFLISEQIKKEH